MSSSEIPCEQGDPGHPTVPKPCSQKKVEANRRNALRSTGPRTAEGKRTVSRNAIKHGLLARGVVSTTLRERAEDFHALLQELWDEYQLVGRTEGMLVERIAASWWRLARVLRAEKGELSKGIAAVKTKSLSIPGAYSNRGVEELIYGELKGELTGAIAAGDERIEFLCLPRGRNNQASPLRGPSRAAAVPRHS